MSDDPFLAKPQEHMTPAELSAQPPAGSGSAGAPAQYSPPPPVQAQPGYPVQPGYPPPAMPYYPGQPMPKTWMNWVALGCGIGALFTCVSGFAAIVFGHMGIAAANRGEADAKGAGIAGLVLGYLSVIVLIGYIVFFVVMIGSAGFQ